MSSSEVNLPHRGIDPSASAGSHNPGCLGRAFCRNIAAEAVAWEGLLERAVEALEGASLSLGAMELGCHFLLLNFKTKQMLTLSSQMVTAEGKPN